MTLRKAIGWKLDRGQREQLLNRFSPLEPQVVADHVTFKSRTEAPLPGPVEAAIVGEARSDGLQAMIVTIDGTTDRPDGSTYHITWSLDPAKGRRAVDSNDVIRTRGWTDLAEPVAIKLEPGSF